MRAMFGVVSLVIVLAVVGILASRQLKAVHGTPSTVPPPSATAPAADVREASQHLQQRVADDVAKALQQGAERKQQADQ